MTPPFGGIDHIDVRVPALPAVEAFYDALMPALGLPGAGIGTTLASCFLFAALAVTVSLDRRFRRYHLFGRFWQE